MNVRRDESLPKLAWYAVINRGVCDVEVGRFVEVDANPEPAWVVSGLWAGDFATGDFHTSEHVFGSGLRLADHEVVVVPAHSMVDRCVYARDGQVWHVSNSLVVLLGRLGARLDPEADHRRWSESTCFGLHNYLRQFSVVHPRFSVMSQLVYEALHLDTAGEASYRLHDRRHTFTDFHDYVLQVKGALDALWHNATDARRRRPMRAVATVSRGYDSPTVLALVQPVIGAPLVTWASARSNTRVPAVVQRLMHTDLSNDDGSEIAWRLGAEPRHLDLDETKIPAELEAWCWASTQSSPELLFHSMLSEADTHDVPTILFSGHGGDAMWEYGLAELTQSGQLIRGSPSGAALIEARVRYGVIDCSPALLFGRSLPSLYKVTRSAELAPWRLDNGYDRPICRRILEERGVPRDAFGWGKKAVAEDVESPQGAELRKLFFEQSGWSPLTEEIYRDVNLGLYFGSRARSFLEFHGDRAKIVWSGRADGKRRLARWTDLQRQTFLMTTGWLADRYATKVTTDAKPASTRTRSRGAPTGTHHEASR